MAGIASLVLTIGADVAGLVQQVDVVRGKIDSFEGIAKKAGVALAGMFTVGAFTAAAREAIDYGGSLTDLAARTGLTVKASQELDFAAKQSGTSIDAVAGVIEKMGVKLAGGDKSAVAALGALGLSLSDLRKMAPDQQFEAISDKLSKIEDPAARAKLAFDTMGKGASAVLPMISEGVGDLRDKANDLGLVLSDQTVAALDDAGDAMGNLKTAGLVLVANVIGPMMPALVSVAGVLAGALSGGLEGARRAFDAVIGLVLRGIASFYDFGAAAGDLARSFPMLADKIGITAGAVDGLKKKAAEWRATAQGFATATTTAGTAAAGLSKAIKPLAVDFDGAARAAKDAKESIVWGEGLSDLDHLFADLGITVGVDYVASADAAGDASAALWDQFYRLTGQVQKVGPAVEASLGGLPALLQGMQTTLEPLILTLGDKFRGAWQGMKEGLNGVLQSVPQTMVSAFTGGGDIMGAVKGIASQVGATAGGSIGFMMGGPMGASIGRALGSLAGPLTGKIVSLFSDPVKKAVQAANVELGKLRDGLLTTYGPLESLDQKARALGLSFNFSDNWAHQGQAGLAAMNKLISEFESKLKSTNAAFAPLLTQAADLGIVLPEALRASVAHLVEIGVLTGDAAAAFGSMGEAGTVNVERMRAAAQLYGVDLASLGPAFQQAALHEAAGLIINDFELLTRGGADVGGVLLGMSDEISKLVQDSIQFGVDIPENMRPWIESLIEAGRLTDANGNKIVDTTKIQFGAPIASQYEVVIGKIGELIDRLGALVTSIVNVPPVNVPVIYHDPGFSPAGATMHVQVDYGDRDNGDDRGGPGFAVGTAGRFLNFGAGTRVTLHGRERIETAAEGAANARAAEGGKMDLLAGFESALQDQTRAIVRGVRDAVILATA